MAHTDCCYAELVAEPAEVAAEPWVFAKRVAGTGWGRHEDAAGRRRGLVNRCA